VSELYYSKRSVTISSNNIKSRNSTKSTIAPLKQWATTV